MPPHPFLILPFPAPANAAPEAGAALGARAPHGARPLVETATEALTDALRGDGEDGDGRVGGWMKADPPRGARAGDGGNGDGRDEDAAANKT